MNWVCFAKKVYLASCSPKQREVDNLDSDFRTRRIVRIYSLQVKVHSRSSMFGVVCETGDAVVCIMMCRPP
jgi:hypothetical protein